MAVSWQSLTDLKRVDFLDFCLERVITSKEPIAIQSLCMKIAYKLCRPFPEWMLELKTVLEMIEDTCPPAIHAAKKNILKAMQKGKRLSG